MPSGMEEHFAMKVHTIRETKAPKEAEPFYQNYQPGVPIAIDFGSDSVKIGMTNSKNPNNVFPNLISKYRDRKQNITLTLVGNDIFREAEFYPTLRSGAKSPFDSLMITNWESVESILDYSLEHLGITSSGYVNNPVIMTEPVAASLNHRKGMYEILFEAYKTPKVAYGIDSLFSFYHNSPKKNGIVVGVGNNLTHIIPVKDGRGIMQNCKRIDWGGDSELQFLQKALALKYPYFPTRINSDHTKHIIHDHAYVSKDFGSELSHYLDMDNLINNDVLVQVPYEAEPEKTKKTEEELARQAERRKENGRRLQEQAQKKRLENIAQKEKELAYYTDIKESISRLSKTEAERRVVEEDFENVADFNKYISNLQRTLKRSSGQDDDGQEEEEDPAVAWPLAEVPDVELNDEEIKEKRKQKLLKANYEARLRLREEKLKEEEQKLKYIQEQEEWRKTNFDDWSKTKRNQLAELVETLNSRKKMMEAMKDRKSMAAQERMRNIADLANEKVTNSTNGKKRQRPSAAATIDNDPNDTFGTNDADWNAYRDISNANLEEEQEATHNEILRIEQELLDFDPEFTKDDTLAASQKFDWQNSVLHKFINGPRPNLMVKMQAEGHDLDELMTDPEIIRRNHQIHINIERIRVPEIYFQPHIGGLDQAGVPEVIQNLLTRSFDKNFEAGGDSRAMIENVFVTGGGSLLPNFSERLKSELTEFLPVGAPLNVYDAQDPILDPWRGMQKWAQSPEAQEGYVTKEEYEEYGDEYIKEHGLGNYSLRGFKSI